MFVRHFAEGIPIDYILNNLRGELQFLKNALIKSTDYEIIHIMNHYAVIRKYNMNACFNLLVLQLLKKAVQRTLGFYYLYNVFSAFYKDTGFMGS